MLFTEKYAPKSIDKMIGNDTAREHVKQWMLTWISGKKKKPLLIHGPPGTGKTTIPYVLADEYELDILEMNASELRNKARVQRIMAGATSAGSLTGKGKILLIDDVDVLAGRKDSGGAGAIVSVLKECKVPIIVTATDIWDKKLSAIRISCENVQLKKVSKVSIRKLLATIREKEKLGGSDEDINQIAEQASGDVRSALNDLQADRSGGRDRDIDIFNRIRTIFKAQTYAEAKEAMKGDVDYNLVKLWVDENIPYEYEKQADVAAAYDILSRADVFEGRIRRTNWQFLRYMIDLSTAGVALAKQQPYRKFTKYNFPGYLKGMSASIAKRAMRKKVGSKIGKIVHSNRRAALEYLPIIKEMLKTNPEAIGMFYDFEDDEIAFVMGTSVSKMKTKKTKK